MAIVSALTLASCGTQSASQAMRSWMSQSAVSANLSQLLSDGRLVDTQLHRASATPGDLHEVCAVLYLEANQAGAALPAPDSQSSALLAATYETLLHAVNACYNAPASHTQRLVAENLISQAGALANEARLRMAAAS